MDLILNKFYETTTEVKKDLEDKVNDQEKITFLESIIIDRTLLKKQLVRLYSENRGFQEIFAQYPELKQYDFAESMFSWGRDPVIEYCNNILEFQYKKVKIKQEEPPKISVKIRISHEKLMVLLERLKVLEYLQKAGLTKTDQAKIISLLIGKDEQNTREYLTYGFQIKEPKNPTKKKYFYNTPENIDYINNLLKGMNIP